MLTFPKKRLGCLHPNPVNSNPVLLARHFQYRVENFFKEIVVKGPMMKILYHVLRYEFQTRGSPHVHCFL